jgi:transcriptional regulator
VLVTSGEGGLRASHLPSLVQEGDDRFVIEMHMARANDQWQQFQGGGEALAIFQGPHAYISPSWYQTHPSVPTWNYAIVHAYGIPRRIEDHDTLYRMLEALVDTHEAGFAQPWRMELPHDYMDKMMRAVVGFEVEITRLEGKLKLSQNRSEDDQRQVAHMLGNSDDPLSIDVAAMMEKR